MPNATYPSRLASELDVESLADQQQHRILTTQHCEPQHYQRQQFLTGPPEILEQDEQD